MTKMIDKVKDPIIKIWPLNDLKKITSNSYLKTVLYLNLYSIYKLLKAKNETSSALNTYKTAQLLINKSTVQIKF